MKNYILFLVSAIMFAFTSCTSSEDIEINDIQSKYQAVFKINPSTVVEPFTWQPTPGELSTIPSNHKLRIRTLIYDMNGTLVTADSTQISNYTTFVNFDTELEKGNYTVVAISDVVQPGDEEAPEYWHLENSNSLNTTKITHAGWIGEQCEILGITSQTISVSETNNEYKIDIQPAGAVIYTYYNSIHEYSDIKRYQLEITQTIEEGVFDSNGKFNGSVENNDNKYLWRLSVVYPEYIDQDGGYVISYVLPQNNLRLRYAAYTYTGREDDYDGDSYWMGKELHISSIKAGDEFYIIADFADTENDYGVETGNVSGLTYPNTAATRSCFSAPFVGIEHAPRIR